MNINVINYFLKRITIIPWFTWITSFFLNIFIISEVIFLTSQPTNRGPWRITIQVILPNKKKISGNGEFTQQIYIAFRVKSIFGHRTIDCIWIWQCNSKTRHLQPPNSQNCSRLAIELFCWVGRHMVMRPTISPPLSFPYISFYPLPLLSSTNSRRPPCSPPPQVARPSLPRASWLLSQPRCQPSTQAWAWWRRGSMLAVDFDGFRR